MNSACSSSLMPLHVYIYLICSVLALVRMYVCGFQHTLLFLLYCSFAAAVGAECSVFRACGVYCGRVCMPRICTRMFARWCTKRYRVYETRLVCLIKGPNSTTCTPCFQVLYNLSSPYCTPYSAHYRIDLFRHTVVHGSVDITPYKSQTLPDTYLSVHTRVQLLYVRIRTVFQ